MSGNATFQAGENPRKIYRWRIGQILLKTQRHKDTFLTFWFLFVAKIFQINIIFRKNIFQTTLYTVFNSNCSCKAKWIWKIIGWLKTWGLIENLRSDWRSEVRAHKVLGCSVLVTFDYFRRNNFADNETAPSSSFNFFKALHINGCMWIEDQSFFDLNISKNILKLLKYFEISKNIRPEKIAH